MSDIVQELSDEENEYIPRIGGEAEFDFSVNDESPFVVVPRGGAKEIGRSCYQVETRTGTYLVDAGLNQGDGGLFPDLRGLDEGQIDAVFLTHAHIDHIGSLPLLESHNFLSDQAPVITTRPTAALADTLLRDSLKIHRRVTQKPGREQQYTETDLRKVIDRFRPCGYQAADLSDQIAHIDDTETLHFEFGNAAHLLGSAWLALTVDGSRVVFSGDIGGRSNHLPDIDEPPQADGLFLESTYGDTHSHTNASDTRTNIFNEAIEAATNGKPVLIPCFGVGRSQELLYMFKTVSIRSQRKINRNSILSTMEWPNAPQTLIMSIVEGSLQLNLFEIILSIREINSRSSLIKRHLRDDECPCLERSYWKLTKHPL